MQTKPTDAHHLVHIADIAAALRVEHIANRNLDYVDPRESLINAAEYLELMDYDIAPLLEARVQRYCVRTELLNGVATSVDDVGHPITDSDCIDLCAPLEVALDSLRDRDWLFVRQDQVVVGLLTRSELHLPAVRMLVFGIILNLESALRHLVPRYTNNRWKMLLGKAEQGKIDSILKRRAATNTSLAEIEASTLGQLFEVVRVTPALGACLSASDGLLNQVTDLRNDLAHGYPLLRDGDTVPLLLDRVQHARSQARDAWALVHGNQDVNATYLPTRIVTQGKPDVILKGAGAGPLLDGSTIYVVSAQNPFDRRLSESENGRRHRNLLAYLERCGLPRTEVVTSSEDGFWTEQSYAIHDCSLDQACHLGRRYNQRAIFRLDDERAEIILCDFGQLLAGRDRRHRDGAPAATGV